MDIDVTRLLTIIGELEVTRRLLVEENEALRAQLAAVSRVTSPPATVPPEASA